MEPGSQARITHNCQNLNIYDPVTVIKYDGSKGYLVKSETSDNEIWIPANALSSHNRKSWSFRFKKSNRKLLENGPQYDNVPEESNPPEIVEHLKNINANCGSTITFRATIRHYGYPTQLTWRKIEPKNVILKTLNVIGNDEKNIATLTIENVKKTDNGLYSFSVSNQFGKSESTATLTVLDSNVSLQEPLVQIVSNTSVILNCDNTDCDCFFVEFCKLGSGEWLSPNQNQVVTSKSILIERLTPGETYSFRIISLENNIVSFPSMAVTLPMADDLRWQQEQFERRYVELEELGRGRFSIVKRAKDRGTQAEVALKLVSRRKQPLEATQAEYSLLAGIQHSNIIRALALFENAPRPGTDTIVLELIKGAYLFSYLSEKDEYSESEAKDYVKQLMTALSWLHNKQINHLDIKPENVLVDVSNPVYNLKLIDFGDAVATQKTEILPPACLEFAPPELVLGKPVGKHTDCWALGVFIYVLLSGVSPFLDDSTEETAANILKCDYCYPPEYFKDISEKAKELIDKLLVLVPEQRITVNEALDLEWIKNDLNEKTTIQSSVLKAFMQRRNMGNIPLALYNLM